MVSNLKVTKGMTGLLACVTPSYLVHKMQNGRIFKRENCQQLAIILTIFQFLVTKSCVRLYFLLAQWKRRQQQSLSCKTSIMSSEKVHFLNPHTLRLRQKMGKFMFVNDTAISRTIWHCLNEAVNDFLSLALAMCEINRN